MPLLPLMEGTESASTVERAHREFRNAQAEMARWPHAVMRMAIGLGLAPNEPKRAAVLTQIEIPDERGRLRPPTDEEIQRLYKEAQADDMAHLRAGTTRAIVDLTRRFVLLNGVSMLEDAKRFPPRDRALAGKLAQKTLEELDGREIVYTKAAVVIGPRPKGETA